MKEQGKVSLISQYAEWIRSYVTDTLSIAKISYLRAKALAKPTGQAATGLTMIGLAATNLDLQIGYVTSMSQGLGPAILNDSLTRCGWRINKDGDDRFISFSKTDLLSLAKLILERFPNG